MELRGVHVSLAKFLRNFSFFLLNHCIIQGKICTAILKEKSPVQREENTGVGASLTGDFRALLLERSDKMDIFVLAFSKEP